MTAPVAPSGAGQPRPLATGQGGPAAAVRQAQTQLLRSAEGGEGAPVSAAEGDGVLRQTATPGAAELTYRPGMAATEATALAAAIAPAVAHAKADGLLAVDPRTASASSIVPTPRESHGRRLRVASVDPLGQTGGVRWLRWGAAVIAVVALVVLVAR